MALDGALEADIESIFSDENLSALEVDSAPTPEQTSPDTPETDTGVADRGDGRDAQGRFVKANAEDVSQQGETAKADAPKESQAADAAPSAELSAQPAPDPSTVKAPDAKAEESAPTGEPLLIPFDGRQLQFPGAVVTPDGVFISKDQMALLTISLGKGAKWDKVDNEARALKTEARNALLRAKHQEEVFLEKMAPAWKEIEHIFELGRAYRSAQTEQDVTNAAVAVLDYVAKFIDAEPLTRERMALAEEKAQLRQQRELSMPDPEEYREQARSQVGSALAENRAAVQGHPKYAILTDQDYQWVDQFVSSNADAFLYQVGTDQRKDVLAEGVPPGTLLFDTIKYAALLDQRAVMRADFQRTLEEHKALLAKQAQVKAENAKRMAAPSAAPAPKSTTAKAATSNGATPTPTRKPTRQELERDMEREIMAAFTD